MEEHQLQSNTKHTLFIYSRKINSIQIYSTIYAVLWCSCLIAHFCFSPSSVETLKEFTHSLCDTTEVLCGFERSQSLVHSVEFSLLHAEYFFCAQRSLLHPTKKKRGCDEMRRKRVIYHVASSVHISQSLLRRVFCVAGVFWHLKIWCVKENEKKRSGQSL